MFDHEINYVVIFSFLGLGSFVFGIDLLVFGFGPIYYKLNYSPYAKFDKLRFHESGIESIFTSNFYSLYTKTQFDIFWKSHINVVFWAYVQFMVLYKGATVPWFTLLSLCISILVYCSTRVLHVNEKNKDLYFPTMKVRFHILWFFI